MSRVALRVFSPGCHRFCHRFSRQHSDSSRRGAAFRHVAYKRFVRHSQPVPLPALNQHLYQHLYQQFHQQFNQGSTVNAGVACLARN